MDRYCVIGSPVDHSLSPDIQNNWFYEFNLEAKYLKEDIPPERLKNKIAYLRDEYKGFNVTYPLKKQIIPYIDRVDPLAEQIESVNTIKKVKDQWVGYNTDILGMKRIIHDTPSSEYFILGSGNMAKTALFSMEKQKVTVVCRDINKGKKICINPNTTSIISFEEFQQLNFVNKVIVNTLSLDVNIEKYLTGKENNILIDSNYNNKIKYSVKEYISGHRLLVLQGLESFFIWTGIRPRTESAYRVISMLN